LDWKVKFEKKAKKELGSLDHKSQVKIYSYLKERIATNEDPKRFGKALRRDLSGLWRYRIGDYRVIVDIQDHELIVLVLRIGNRKNIYTGYTPL